MAIFALLYFYLFRYHRSIFAPKKKDRIFHVFSELSLIVLFIYYYYYFPHFMIEKPIFISRFLISKCFIRQEEGRTSGRVGSGRSESWSEVFGAHLTLSLSLTECDVRGYVVSTVVRVVCMLALVDREDAICLKVRHCPPKRVTLP